MLDLDGSCGALGAVSVFATGKDHLAYPQQCGTQGAIQMSVGGEGDAGWLAYATFNPGGSCTVGSGPTTGNLGQPVSLSGTVANGSGKTHTLSYSP